MNPQVEIRKAFLEDAAAIAKIHVKTWQNTYAGIFPEDFLKNLSVEQRILTWQKILSIPTKLSTTFVYTENNVVIGWCEVGPNRDKDGNSKIGEVWAIYISPEDQGKGVGKQLLERGLNQLRADGYTQATLWVISENKKARRFYEANGWQVETNMKTTRKGAGFDVHETRYIINL